ncbi:MAG: polysaccharide biosynthesis/export family protein [Pseudomonadota bacterium]
MAYLRTLLLLALALVSGAAHAQGSDEPYRIGVQDELAIRAVTWSEIEGRYLTWQAIGGTYRVGPMGTISVPLAGEIAVLGQTTDNLQGEIAGILQGILGASEAPSLAIEIVRYRPIFVIGEVERPGEHAFTPGLTALQAFALAGGAQALLRGDNTNELIRNLGRARGIERELAWTRAREVRLLAETEDAAEVAFPEDLAHPDGPTATKDMLDQERALFEARQSSLAREIEALENLKNLLSSEIESLELKLVGQTEQLDRVRETVSGMQRLVDQGLARNPRLVEIQGLLINLEAREIDLRDSIFRAEQRISVTNREIIELRADRTTEAAEELQRVRTTRELLENDEDTFRSLILAAGVGLDEVDEDTPIEFTLIRGTGEELTREQVGEGARLQPGDVLEISRAAQGAEDGAATPPATD